MNKKVFLIISAAFIIAVAAINFSLSLNNKVTPTDLVLAEVEAKADWGEALQEWWDSKVYRCVEDVCSITWFNKTWYGKYEKCKDGSDFAHCTSCSNCDAGT